jgi:hypothetical protein
MRGEAGQAPGRSMGHEEAPWWTSAARIPSGDRRTYPFAEGLS